MVFVKDCEDVVSFLSFVCRVHIVSRALAVESRDARGREEGEKKGRSGWKKFKLCAHGDVDDDKSRSIVNLLLCKRLCFSCALLQLGEERAPVRLRRRRERERVRRRLAHHFLRVRERRNAKMGPEEKREKK